MPTQFELNFNEANPLAERFRHGRFVTVIEYTTPHLNQPFDSALVPGVALARRVSELPEVLGMVVTDRNGGYDVIDTAAALKKAADLPVSITISGKGMTREILLETLGRAESVNLQNVILVTGDGIDARNGAKPHPAGYMDSIELLSLADPHKRRLCLGAAINPYKYTAVDMYLQYYKMARKLAAGANYLVAQAGWDMKKLQELQWYMQQRDIQVPVIARLHLVHPDEADSIHLGLYPGVPVARTYVAKIQREHQNATQPGKFQDIQLERLELQIAGCRILGYSGVQIVGIRDVQTLNKLAERLRQFNEKYPSYDRWLEAWDKFNDGISLVPTPQAFYGYKQLLSPGHAMYDEAVAKPEAAMLPQATDSVRCRGAMLPALLSHRMPNWIHDLTRKMFFPECTAEDSRLPFVFFCNPAECPKKLVFGACGGAGLDGLCEFGDRPCFFHKVFAAANRTNRLSDLEKPISES
jgi:methylenetetrahydrofolate reductase (NADPH)